MMTDLKGLVKVGLIACFTLMSSCDYSYSVQSVEGGRVAMTSEYDALGENNEVTGILNKYKAHLDSIMSPVVGHAAHDLLSYRPESPMSNLMSDVLFAGCEQYTGKKADVAIMNIGGIRSSISRGPITFGNIYEISPFENSLCILEMDGKSLYELFTQIAARHGEGISGANLVITEDGELISAKVGGKAVDFNKIYVVSTLDYVAEGNDKMTAVLKAKSKYIPHDATLRSLLMNYVKNKEKEGVLIDAKEEGRIIEKKNK